MPPSDDTPLASSAASAAQSRSDPAKIQVEFGALTHEGRVRPTNEDHYLVARFGRTMSALATNLPDDTIPTHYSQAAYAMLVADGMGGAAGGEVASREAIGSIVELALETPDWIMSLDERSLGEVLRRFTERFRRAKELLVEHAESDSSLRGMGTTMTMAVSLGPELIVAHVGDSRAYLYRQGQLRQLTRDHTFAQALADGGAIRPEEVATHPMAHTLLNALGTHGEEVRVELHHLRLEDGDQLLLATDGLSDMVDAATIAREVGASRPAGDTCRELVERALEAGGRDNVTAVLCRYHIPASGD